MKVSAKEFSSYLDIKAEMCNSMPCCEACKLYQAAQKADSESCCDYTKLDVLDAVRIAQEWKETRVERMKQLSGKITKTERKMLEAIGRGISSEDPLGRCFISATNQQEKSVHGLTRTA